MPPGSMWVFWHFLSGECILCLLLVTQGIVKQKKASCKPICFTLKDVYCLINFKDQVIIIKIAILCFSCSEEETCVMISLFFRFYLTFRSSFHSIPFGPYFLSFPMSLLHEAFLVSLIYDSQALRLTSFHPRHCLAQPSTALWLTLTPFHLEAAPPLYFPSVWLTMTRPLSFPDNP